MQAATGLVFALIVCDEAHRTAGVASVAGEDTAFALVHDNELVPAVKRLYMTATPRLFKPVAADAAKEADAILASMDDPAFFGEEFHRLGQRDDTAHTDSLYVYRPHAGRGLACALQPLTHLYRYNTR